MKFSLKDIIQYIIFILLAAVLYMIGNSLGIEQGKNTIQLAQPVQLPQKIVKVFIKPKGTIVNITQKDLEAYLVTYETHLSSRERKVILKAIETTSAIYKISPLILFATIGVESSFRPYITHKAVIIKGKKDRAIGLTGVMYSWWGKQLKEKGIIETKTDLYNPTINIKACGFILNELRKRPLKKGTTNSNISMLRYYFGGNSKTYSNSIKNRIGTIVFNKIFK